MALRSLVPLEYPRGGQDNSLETIMAFSFTEGRAYADAFFSLKINHSPHMPHPTWYPFPINTTIIEDQWKADLETFKQDSP